MTHTAVPPLIGLDLNATSARAVSGAAGCSQALPLDSRDGALPLAVSLEGRTLEVGRAGADLCRQAPHLVCHGFLPYLGEPREWAAGRHRLDAARALGLVFDHLRSRSPGAQGLVLALPSYLSPVQIAMLAPIAGKSRLPILGSVPAALAAALAGYAEQPWSGPALVVDADDHALTWSMVAVNAGQVRALSSQTSPHLGLRIWKERLLNAVADRCVRQSRRDPRDSAPAEQMLHDQLDTALDACRQGQLANLLIQGTNWCQNVILQPDEIIGCCASFVGRALEEMEAFTATVVGEAPSAVLVTAAAGRLPGLVATLQQGAGEPVALDENEEPPSDFGEGLLDEGNGGAAAVSVLAADALARAAHSLAGRFHSRDLPRAHLDEAPLPRPLPVDEGPARLQFQGQDYPLRTACFTLGRHSTCHLVFDSVLYPSVSTRHCEIVLERRAYVVRDRSLNGTFVNDRPVFQQLALHPGDLIRLGPGGPLLRFLGQAVDQRKFMTTA